jgi:hypothetical protein
MGEQSILDLLHDEEEPATRSPLLMPIMEGSKLGGDDLSGFLKDRLERLRDVAPVSQSSFFG